MMMFTNYSDSLLKYLSSCGNDVSRITDRLSAGERLTFICSHHRARGGWIKGLDATQNERPGEYLDEKAIMVNENEFFEWHGGERVHGGI